MITTQNMFCVEEHGSFNHIYPCSDAVEMCGVSLEDIIEIVLTPDENGDYWCWYDFERKTFSMVFSKFILLEMCFPYGIERDIELGYGKPVKVRIEKVDVEKTKKET